MEFLLDKLIVMIKNMVYISEERWVLYFWLFGIYKYIFKRR